MTAFTAAELKQDLIDAFDSDDFQYKLLELKNAHFSDCTKAAVAMRDTAMVAQKVVLRKHSFPESFTGLAEMVAALSSHLMFEEKLSYQKAAAKAKALALGLESSQTSGWSWPKPALSPQTNSGSQKSVYQKGMELTAVQAAQLQKDLIDAFGTTDFQSKLESLRAETHADSDQFVVAKRDAAMVAQKAVLRKYGFPETFAGVAEMMAVLTSHFVLVENVSQEVAANKAKGLMVGMAASQINGWSWPEFTPNGSAESQTCGKYTLSSSRAGVLMLVDTADTLPDHVIDDEDDAVSTTSLSSEDDSSYISGKSMKD
jgi:hypothetical protein